MASRAERRDAGADCLAQLEPGISAARRSRSAAAPQPRRAGGGGRRAPRRRGARSASPARGHSFTETAMTDGTMIDVGALERRDRRRPRLRAGQGRRRARCSPTSTRSCTGSAWRWRTSATSTARRSPARSRPAPTAPARSCATSPPRSRRWSWSSPTAACASWTPSEPDLLRAARVEHRRARRDLGGDPALRPRLHPAPGRLAASRARRSSTASSERADAHEHFELFTFPYADSALVLERNRTDGPAAAARPGRRLPQRRRARELGAGGDLRRRQGSVPAAIPRLSRLAARARLGRHGRPIAATGSSPTSAASASPRWSTACRASTGPRRCAG